MIKKKILIAKRYFFTKTNIVLPLPHVICTIGGSKKEKVRRSQNSRNVVIFIKFIIIMA